MKKIIDVQHIPWHWAVRVLHTLSVAVLLASGLIGTAKADPRIVLGDYSAELRIPSGAHVDADRLVKRLSDLGANTYMWLLNHNSNDWADLAIFLPKAKLAGITVWVYLVPYTETPEQDPTYRYSEPYRLDYVRWAQEIAKLSLQYPNLTGYVIDDFWRNIIPDAGVKSPERFTVDYIRKMVAAGKAINPKLKFFPLIYFNQFNSQFADILGSNIDGVVAAYPPSEAEVERALSVLNDQLPRSATIIFPPEKHSKPGDHGFIYQDVHVDGSKPAQLTFRYHSDYTVKATGYHQLQVRVDGHVVWDEDIAGHSDGTVTVDLTKAVEGKQTVKLSFGVYDAKGVGNFDYKVSFGDLTVHGLNLQALDMGQSSSWLEDVSGDFSVQYAKQPIGGRFHLPMIAMPAGSMEADKDYQHSAGTPQSIASKVGMLTGMAENGRIEGVVTYCLDKHDGSKTFEAVQKVFKSITPH